MTNLQKLRDGGVLKDYTELTAAERAIVDSLDQAEIDLAIETHDPPMSIFHSIFSGAGIGVHHVVGTSDEEPEP
jgi:hypothetical protein